MMTQFTSGKIILAFPISHDSLKTCQMYECIITHHSLAQQSNSNIFWNHINDTVLHDFQMREG